MVMLKKRSFVSTGSVFCRMITTQRRANMAVNISLKRFKARSLGLVVKIFS